MDNELGNPGGPTGAAQAAAPGTMAPTPDGIRAARRSAGLTQAEAAALLGKALRTWQGWEAPIGASSHRSMDPALLELFSIKISRMALAGGGTRSVTS